jgi:hypothetical protein
MVIRAARLKAAGSFSQSLSTGIPRIAAAALSCRPISHNSAVHLSVPSRFLRDQIRQRYEVDLLAAWRAQSPRVERVEIEVKPLNFARPVEEVSH